jgi:16S rRNA (cytidine1402-2'-O)-methyltransferase
MDQKPVETGTLYLIPAPLGEVSAGKFLPGDYKNLIAGLKVFIVENLRTARRVLKKIDPEINIDLLSFHILDKQTTNEELDRMLDSLKMGEDIGLLSEAGLPCIADPGARVVFLSHQLRAKVVPIPGPSSILLALVASGFNGQNFTFYGYLPRQEKERKKSLLNLESQALKTGASQVFMETPYRNNALVESLLQTCHPDTMLCIACDISLPTEFISTRSIAKWTIDRPDIHKRPAIFIIGTPEYGK